MLQLGYVMLIVISSLGVDLKVCGLGVGLGIESTGFDLGLT